MKLSRDFLTHIACHKLQSTLDAKLNLHLCTHTHTHAYEHVKHTHTHNTGAHTDKCIWYMCASETVICKPK